MKFLSWMQPAVLKKLSLNRLHIKAGLELYGLFLLTCTTLLWAFLGASLHTGNADQLVDSYLFEDANSFNGSSFPVQHTFLMKWPLFWLQSVFGLNNVSFVLFTVAVVLLTVGAIIVLIRRIEARPNVRGLLYLGLASILLLTPPVPYPGALLPTNFAMLTTRNIEYVLYIVALVLLAKSRQYMSRYSILGAVLMLVLFLSDGLFPPLSVGGAGLLLIIAAILRKRDIRAFAIRWLGASVMAYVAATTLLKIAEVMVPGRFNGQGSPYAFTNTLYEATLAVIYGVLGVLTNFGANPAYGAKTIGGIPQEMISELGSYKLGAYLLNGALVCLLLLASVTLVRNNFFHERTHRKQANEAVSKEALLALGLLSTSLVAFVSFIATDHYYLVDSRYLAIFFFSGVVSTAIYIKTKSISQNTSIFTAVLCTVAILSACYGAIRTHRVDVSANAAHAQRNESVAQTLNNEKVEVLVGDYWRVLPIRVVSQSNLSVLPLADCTSPRTVLTSTAWEPKLNTVKFAYLLTLDGSATDFPACSMEQVIKRYGTPIQQQVVAGTESIPSELLLFFDSAKQ